MARLIAAEDPDLAEVVVNYDGLMIVAANEYEGCYTIEIQVKVKNLDYDAYELLQDDEGEDEGRTKEGSGTRHARLGPSVLKQPTTLATSSLVPGRDPASPLLSLQGLRPKRAFVKRKLRQNSTINDKSIINRD